jgi:hypothetical protein
MVDSADSGAAATGSGAGADAAATGTAEADDFFVFFGAASTTTFSTGAATGATVCFSALVVLTILRVYIIIWFFFKSFNANIFFYIFTALY